jgi:collagenase-like PrtC family protease
MEMNDLPGALLQPPTAEPEAEALAGASHWRTKISLDALAYYWPRQRVFDFYQGVAKLPVDIVYLGETICSRRHELRLDEWVELAAMLADAGKEPVLSTQALIESESDLKSLRRLIDAAESDNRFTVEANEFGAVRLLAERQLTFVAGPSLNVFNPETLGLLAEQGASRWVMPPEMSGEMLGALMRGCPTDVATEVMVWGRLPLAMSARCFTARHFNLQKDGCEFKCIEFPEGLPLRTRDGDSFLVLNGVQTQSAKVYNLLNDLPALRHAGVDVVRISPQAEGIEAVVSAFRRGLDAADGTPAVCPLPGREASCNGFWHGRPGLELIE